MSRLLLDASAYVVHLRDHAPAREALRAAEEIFMSPIVLGELRAGYLKGSRAADNESVLRDFLSSPRVRTVVVDEGTSDRYAMIHDFLRRRGTPIPVNDLWIAASAAQHGLRLLTTDPHFKDIPYVLVEWIAPPAG